MTRAGKYGGRVWGGLAAGLGLGVALAAGCGDVSSGPAGPGSPEDRRNVDFGPESTDEQKAALVIFDETRIHDARLLMAPEDWQSITDDTRGDDWRRATLFLDGVVVGDVGVRPSGESSRVPGNPKMSVRIQFDAFRPGAAVGGFDEIKLSGSWDHPFMVRDRLAYWYFRQVMPTPREVATHLTVNGEDRGAYEIEEIWSRHSVGAHFPSPVGGLYRLRGTIGFDPYAFKGADPAAYVPLPWYPKGKHETDDAIGNALAVLAQNPAALGGVMDIDYVMNYFAGNAILANTDGFTGELEVDDHFQYFDPATGKFFMLPWDPDNTFGSINDPPDRDIFKNFDKSILTRMVRDDPAMREAFLAKLESMMAGIPLASVNAAAEQIHGQIHDMVAEDTLKQYPTEHFVWSLGYVEGFIAARYASVAQQIAMYRAVPPVPPGQQPPPPDTTTPPPPDTTTPPDPMPPMASAAAGAL